MAGLDAFGGQRSQGSEVCAKPAQRMIPANSEPFQRPEWRGWLGRLDALEAPPTMPTAMEAPCSNQVSLAVRDHADMEV